MKFLSRKRQSVSERRRKGEGDGKSNLTIGVGEMAQAKRPEFCSQQHIRWLTVVCNISSRAQTPSSGLLGHLYSHAQNHPQYIHIIKNKFTKKKKS